MGQDKKVLIVDDEIISTRNITLYLKRYGYDVILASGGKKAISILEKTFFPVILLDVKMPDLDGDIVLKFIVEKHPTSKVFMLTGHQMGISKEEFLKMGAYDYILKPVDIQELAKTLNKLYE